MSEIDIIASVILGVPPTCKNCGRPIVRLAMRCHLHLGDKYVDCCHSEWENNNYGALPGPLGDIVLIKCGNCGTHLDTNLFLRLFS